MFRKSFSSDDLNNSNLKVIEKLLNVNVPKLKSIKSTVLQKDVDSKSSKNTRKRKYHETEESISYYPTVDTSVWMRSCEREVIEPITGKSSGSIPSWLRGTLLRNGPGSLKVGEYRFEHLFDSSALLHRFEINGGKVTYQNRFIQTDVYKKNHAAKRIVVTEFGTKSVPDPCQSIFQRVSSMFNTELMSDNTMISVYPFDDEYYTFTEIPTVHRIDPKSLETLGKVNVANYVNIVSHTSHPHVMDNGTVYNLGLRVTKTGPAYSIVEFSSSSIPEGDRNRKISMFEQAKIISTVPCRWMFNPSYMHTFGITDNYFIIVEQPFAVGLTSIISCKLKNESMIACLKWHENENTHIKLVSRCTGKVTHTFVAEAFFFLHIINQYETQGGKHIILDICCYRDAKMLECMYVQSMQNMHQNPDYSKLFRGRPLRFILPLETTEFDASPEISSISNKIESLEQATFNGITDDDRQKYKKRRKENSRNTKQRNLFQHKAEAYRLTDGTIFVIPELLCDLGCETPRINNKFYLGKKYRYFYGMSSDVDIENPGTIIKVDLKTKTKKTWCEKNIYPSEPIFVPDPDGKEFRSLLDHDETLRDGIWNEDDGVILSALVWGQERENEVGLLVLNAASFNEIARVTFETTGPVPKCLHGWFCDVVS